MLRILRIFFRLAGYVVLTGYLAACVLVLAARYWFLPNIDQWRTQITHYLSARFGVDLQAGHIEADWKGTNPRIALSGVSLSSAAPGASPASGSLEIPRLTAQLQWRSLFSNQPVFENLDASGISLDIRRDQQGRLHALGQTFEPDMSDQHGGLLGEFLQWLGAQQRIVLRNVSLRWTDQLRAAPPLNLDDVTLTLGQQGASRSFTLLAQLPEHLGRNLDVRAVLSGAGPASHDFRAAEWMAQLNAQLYVEVSQLNPQALSPWMDLPATLALEQVSARARLDLKDGTTTLTSLLDLDQANWHPGHGAQVAARSLQVYLRGAVDQYRQVFHYHPTGPQSEPAVLPPDHPEMAPWDAGHAIKPHEASAEPPPSTPSSASPGIEYRVVARGLQVKADYIFNHPLGWQAVAGHGYARQPEPGRLQVGIEQAHVINADAQASVSGSWRQAGSSAAGMIDLQGDIQRASIAAIHRYLPERINEHASHWLEYGLLAGELHDASLLLRGDLVHFPFQERPDTGNFRIEGPYEGGIIDYLPAHGTEKGWPRLEAMKGIASLYRADLRLTAQSALTRPAPGQVIQLSDVKARIPNLEHEPVLAVQGETLGAASAYLSLMTHSPLGGLLDHVFDRASADGDWSVPLSLTVPLTHGHDTEVQGEIRFDGNSLRLTPEMPVLADTQGTLAFSHEGAAAKGLSGRFLGGKMTLSGQVGGQGEGLRMAGRIDAAALARYTNLRGMQRLTGSLPYDALLSHIPGKPYSLRIISNLKGLAIDLPAPLGKQSQDSRNMEVIWAREPGSRDPELTVKLGDFGQVLLQHRADGPSSGPYFSKGAVGIHHEPVLPGSGLRLDLRYPEISIDAWRKIEDTFALPLRPDAAKRSAHAAPGPVVDAGTTAPRTLLPSLTQLHMQSRKATFHGMKLDDLQLAARRVAGGRWRLDVESKQTAGVVTWKEVNDKIEGAVRADFSRLAIGSPETAPQPAHDAVLKRPENDENPLGLEDEIDFPAVNLHVGKLSLYGRHVGKLVLQGAQQTQGQTWRLDHFTLSAPSARLAGSGAWRLAGADRGLTIKAHADIDNLGAYLKQIGYHDVVVDGSGTLDGEIQWRNMPWVFSTSDINGALRFDLAKGRFSKLNSNSARLLELLSLQSVKRLARLQVDPGGVMRDGFPFDNLRATVVARDGILSTRDYRVNGPVGTIALEGRTNLADESLDLQAVVIPNLDVSGAAIAAGIAINPIVGVGAFLGQWLLQAPLSRAMASQYRIAGTWSDPQITEEPAPEQAKTPPQRKEPPP